jgi:hypothetical protein
MDAVEVSSTSSTSPAPPFPVKLSYASIASKGVVLASDAKRVTFCETASYSEPEPDESGSDFSDFTVVTSRKKKDMTKKCENAVLQWAARSKGQAAQPVSKCSGDEELICNRCALPFIFNAKTKEKYVERGWKVPKICKVCSQTRFEERR